MTILLLGSSGMLGKSLKKNFLNANFSIITPTRNELDLEDNIKVKKFFEKNRFNYIVNTAAKVGGILENKNNQVEFYKRNIDIAHNIIENAHRFKIKNLINMGSSCMYPGHYKTKISESMTMTGKLEETNIGYAMAKLSSAIYLKLLRENNNYNYTNLIPCNLYGPNDNFNKNSSHLIASIIRKVIKAKHNNEKSIEVWGDGKVRREFLYIEDLSNFITNIIKNKKKLPLNLNLGYGRDFTVTQFYKKVMKACNYEAKLVYNNKKPTGVNRKILNSDLALTKYKWEIKTNLDEGIKKTINFYQKYYV